MCRIFINLIPCLLILISNGSGNPLPDPLNDEQIQHLVSSAKPDGTPHKQPKHYHIFPLGNKAIVMRKGDGKPAFEKEFIQTKATKDGHLVILRSNEEMVPLQSELLRFHEPTGLYIVGKFSTTGGLPSAPSSAILTRRLRTKMTASS